MSRRRGQRLALLSGFCITLGCTLALLTLTLWLMGTSSGFMLASMRRYAPPETTGLYPEEYEPVARMTCDYLSGKNPVFQYERELPDSAVFPLFHSYEQAHMADCRALFQLDRILCVASAALLLLSAGCALFTKDGKETARGMRWGLGMTTGDIALLAIWSVWNFDGLFITFHKLAFTNQLWLLNPRTDLLIRLMPTPFFTHCVMILAIVLVLTQALLFAFSALLGRRQPEGVSI